MRRWIGVDIAVNEPGKGSETEKKSSKLNWICEWQNFSRLKKYLSSILTFKVYFELVSKEKSSEY